MRLPHRRTGLRAVLWGGYRGSIQVGSPADRIVVGVWLPMRFDYVRRLSRQERE